MSNWTEINKHRERNGRFGTDDSDGFNGLFWMWIGNERLRIIASDGLGWKHVSVTRRDSARVPTWEMMCAVKDLFWEETDWVVQFHPPKSEYVNNHPGCLHLWQPTEQKLPVPDSILVGIKGATRKEIQASAANY